MTERVLREHIKAISIIIINYFSACFNLLGFIDELSKLYTQRSLWPFGRVKVNDLVAQFLPPPQKKLYMVRLAIPLFLPLLFNTFFYPPPLTSKLSTS